MSIAKRFGKALLADVTRLIGEPFAVRSIRFVLNRLALPERLRLFLIWQVTTYVLPANYSEDVFLPDGTIMRVGLDDIVNRRLLYFSKNTEYCWEPETSRFIFELIKDRRIVVVGGAHIGYHAILIAKRLQAVGGQVHAFEPVSAFFGKLQTSKRLNNLECLYENRGVLAHKAGQEKVHLSNIGSSLYAANGDGSGPFEELSSFNLEDYAEARGLSEIDLILLDIEGAELQVLRGSLRLLSAQPGPDIIFEVNREVLKPIGLQETELYDFLRPLGYRLFLIEDDYEVETCVPPISIGPVKLHAIDGPANAFSALRWFNVYATKDIARLGAEVQILSA